MSNPSKLRASLAKDFNKKFRVCYRTNPNVPQQRPSEDWEAFSDAVGGDVYEWNLPVKIKSYIRQREKDLLNEVDKFFIASIQIAQEVGDKKVVNSLRILRRTFLKELSNE